MKKSSSKRKWILICIIILIIILSVIGVLFFRFNSKPKEEIKEETTDFSKCIFFKNTLNSTDTEKEYLGLGDSFDVDLVYIEGKCKEKIAEVTFNYELGDGLTQTKKETINYQKVLESGNKITVDVKNNHIGFGEGILENYFQSIIEDEVATYTYTVNNKANSDNIFVRLYNILIVVDDNKKSTYSLDKKEYLYEYKKNEGELYCFNIDDPYCEYTNNPRNQNDDFIYKYACETPNCEYINKIGNNYIMIIDGGNKILNLSNYKIISTSMQYFDEKERHYDPIFDEDKNLIGITSYYKYSSDYIEYYSLLSEKLLYDPYYEGEKYDYYNSINKLFVTAYNDGKNYLLSTTSKTVVDIDSTGCGFEGIDGFIIKNNSCGGTFEVYNKDYKFLFKVDSDNVDIYNKILYLKDGNTVKEYNNSGEFIKSEDFKELLLINENEVAYLNENNILYLKNLESSTTIEFGEYPDKCNLVSFDIWDNGNYELTFDPENEEYYLYYTYDKSTSLLKSKKYYGID